jgi:hypothetical protein
VSLLEYQYRRRYLDGETGISIVAGITRARPDDADVWVFDYLLAEPLFTTPVVGRRGTSIVTLARPLPAAVRLWLWPNRPLRILHYFDATGQPTLYRVDFATRPQRHANTIYQTDLYLDLFTTPDEREYAILDEDEFAEAIALGLVPTGIREQILAQSEQLVALLEARQLGAWLASRQIAAFNIQLLGETPIASHSLYLRGEADGWPEERDTCPT